MVAGATMETGTLGSASVVHGRATIGATFHGWELYTGYDFLRVGNVNLQGPVVGLRFWF